MGFLASAIARKSTGLSGLSIEDVFREIYGRRMTSSGRRVTLTTAIEVSTVYACARVIGNGMAQVPLKLMRVSADGKTRLPATDHPLYDLLACRPNPWQTSFEFRQMMSWHVELCGNFFAFKNAPLGDIRELIPFTPGQVKVIRNPDLSLEYEVTAESGSVRRFPAESIWHVRGPSWNSWMGLDSLLVAREAIGLAMATEESQASLHRNGVQSTGSYSVTGQLNEVQYKALSEWIEREQVGSRNSGRPMILDRDAKWVSSQMTGVDAQHLETRRFQIEEVCRFFVVNPIMVGYSDKASTYASAEQMFLSHSVNTLSPRWQMYEQSIDANLLTEAERKAGLYSDFCEEGMIRGSSKDTKDVILGYVNGGVMTPNEGRAKLDMNPDDDPASDELRIPVTAVQAPADGDEGTPGGEPAKAPTSSDSTSKAILALATAISEQKAATVTFEKGAFEIRQAPVNVSPTTIFEEGAIKSEPHVEVNTHPGETKFEMQAGAVQLGAGDAPVNMRLVGSPARTSVSETERDASGNIKRVRQTEKDA